MNHTRTILLLLLTGGFLIRAAGLATHPPALNSDELLKVFDGASVYRTGMDHHGQSWPLFFKQSGEYSPPLYIYYAGLFSTFFGINEYTTRLPSSLLGTLSILMTFFFVQAFADRKTALIAAALAAVSPWNVHYSRIGWEAILLAPLQLGGLWAFLRWTKNERLRHLLASASFWGLTIYAYPVARLSSTMLMTALWIVYWKTVKRRPKQAAIAVGLFVLWLLPYLAVLSRNYQAMQARWNFVSVFNRGDGFVLFLKQYFMHLSPDFLFLRGNPNSLHQLAGGLALFVLLPFFFAGLVFLLRRRNKMDWILLAWFFTFPIPSSMTYDRFDPFSMPNPLRSINGMPLLEIISAIGVVWILNRVKSQPWRRCAGKAIAALVIANALYIAYDAVFQYPARSAPVWQYGLREAVQFVDSQKEQYDRIVVSHKVRLHPVALACFTNYEPGPLEAEKFKKYVLPFPHYVRMYADFDNGYGRYGTAARWYTLARGRNLLVAAAGEIEAEPIKRIYYPDGSAAYEIFESDR
ncbi:MAG: glycosyltransferase family 39 protein [Candidatus Omnitrophica bacterium]|nr:glycosyltransferase family 39 protein [Candidatus Omnitrophota bacterium]